MRSLFLAPGVAALFAAMPAGAAEHPMKTWFAGKDVCYSRVYPASHLASHPRQRLAGIQLVHPFPYADPSSAFRLGLRYSLKTRGATYGAISVGCEGNADGGLDCSIEGDQGRFRLTPGPGAALTMRIERMEVEGRQDFSPDLGQGGDDNVVILRKSPMNACPSNRRR